MAKCKICGNELVKKKTKSGEVVLYCTDCKKIYKLKAKAEEVKKKAEEEEEEEEEAPAPVAKKVVKPAPAPFEEEEEEEAPAPAKAAPIPAIAPAPAPAANSADLASIAESLAEINASLKGLLKIFNNIYKS